MKIAKEKVDLKKTLIAILTMLLGVVCVDLYLVVIRFIGNDYSVFKLAVFINLSGIVGCFHQSFLNTFSTFVIVSFTIF